MIGPGEAPARLNVVILSSLLVLSGFQVAELDHCAIAAKLVLRWLRCRHWHVSRLRTVHSSSIHEAANTVSFKPPHPHRIVQLTKLRKL
jgi:hypothetical protein